MNMTSAPATTRVLVLGASGGVGRQVVAQALSRGMAVTAQTRQASRLADLDKAAQVVSLDPTDSKALEAALRGHDAVVFALGGRRRRTTLFSDATRALLAAMRAAGVRRLLAITGVGAGDSRGHGGFVYDRLIFPLFTRHMYADKDIQERLIEAADVDWVIVRPAPFVDKPAANQLQALTRIEPDTVLRRITRSEVAAFVLDQLGSDAYLRTKVFIGHP